MTPRYTVHLREKAMDGKAYWVSWKLGYRKIGYSKISPLIIIQCPILFPIKIIAHYSPVYIIPQLKW